MTALQLAAILATCALIWWRSHRWSVGRPVTQVAHSMAEPGPRLGEQLTTRWLAEGRRCVVIRQRPGYVVAREAWPTWWRLAAAVAPLGLVVLTGLRP